MDLISITSPLSFIALREPALETADEARGSSVPGRPVPITRPSHSTTGISSAAVPVRKHSSALIHVVTVHRPLDHRVAGRASQLDHGIASDPFEDARVDRRRMNLAAVHDEDVVAGALGDLALVVEHQGFQAAGVGPLDLGEDVVQVVERLDPRIDGVGMIASRRGRDDLQAVVVQLFRVEADVVGDDDDLRVGRLARVEAQAAGPAGDDEADVGVG